MGDEGINDKTKFTNVRFIYLFSVKYPCPIGEFTCSISYRCIPLTELQDGVKDCIESNEGMCDTLQKILEKLKKYVIYLNI